ncbi:hypothetical protein ACQ4M4_04180 [Leptolyngbya sp. AN02str]|uniref:hypothetical protein n=1 Tax=Leptolyngbya sp. AN02str TaxID=3423363 RepID=UPI003D31273B
MATLGGIEIIESGFNFGAAFLLNKKSPISRTVLIENGSIFELNENSSYAVIKLSENVPKRKLPSLGYAQIQRGLDIISVEGRAHLLIKDLSHYLIWWKSNEGSQVVKFFFKEILTTSIYAEPSQLVEGEIINSPQASIKYAEAFRYFRLSKATDDLFDAYRNMYLAFEYLLSLHYPREKIEKDGKERRESEFDWITRGFTRLMNETKVSELLNHYFDSSSANFVKQTCTEIYKTARTNLFHAKRDELQFSFYENLEERELISTPLEKLTIIVQAMLEYFHEVSSLRGGMSTALLDKFLVDSSQSSRLLFRNRKFEPGMDPDTDQEDVLDIKSKSSVSTLNKIVGRGKDNKLLLQGFLKSEGFPDDQLVRQIEAWQEENIFFWHSLEEDLILEGIDKFEFECHLDIYQNGQPNCPFRQ